jgi:hypothetical protein
VGASSASVGDAPFTEVVKIPHVTTTMETVWLRKSWSWIRRLALDAVLSRVGVQNLARACVCDSAVDARRGRWRRVQLIAFEAVPSYTQRRHSTRPRSTWAQGPQGFNDFTWA